MSRWLKWLLTRSSTCCASFVVRLFYQSAVKWPTANEYHHWAIQLPICSQPLNALSLLLSLILNIIPTDTFEYQKQIAYVHRARNINYNKCSLCPANNRHNTCDKILCATHRTEKQPATTCFNTACCLNVLIYLSTVTHPNI